MQYIMQSGALVCKHYDTEIDDFMVFCHEQSSITCQIIASILYMELAWFRGYPYTFPVIPPQLEKKASGPDDAPLPKCPKESCSHCTVGHRENCQVWWCHLLALLQDWKDADSPYPYGGLLCRNSKLMMYVYYWIKCLLHLGKINLHHYSIKNQTPWMVFMRKHYSMHQVMKQRESYATICEELQEMKNCLHKCYEVEADGNTLKCIPEEERALLNPLFTGSLDQLEDVLLGYLNVLVACINQIRKVKVLQMAMLSPRAPPGLSPLGMGQPDLDQHQCPALQCLLVKLFTQLPVTWEPQFSTQARGCPCIDGIRQKRTKL